MMNQQKIPLKERAISETKKFAVIVAYLWMLFVLLQLHRLMILRELNPPGSISYRVGFALINALILGKIILIAQAFHLGEGFKNRPLVYAILFRSIVFAVLLISFDILEEVLVGLFRRKTVSESIPALGGGGAEGMLLVGLMAFIVLIPFFSFTEVARVLGENDLFLDTLQAASENWVLGGWSKAISDLIIKVFSVANLARPVVLARARQPICKRCSICKC